jgi:type I restriction enzyme S subunit
VFGDAYPFITPTDMDGRRVLDRTERGLSEKGANLVNSSQVPEGSVAVSCIGWQMGKAVLVTRPSFTNQQLNTVVPTGEVLPEFLYYHLCTRQAELKNLGSVGVRTPILNKSRFEELEIAVPPEAIQRRIVGLLSAYDELVENNTKRVKILEEIARSLYRDWFVSFRFPGHEKTKLVSSRAGKIPEGWRPCLLGDLVDEIRDAVDPAEVAPATPYFGLEHLPRRSIALGEWGQAGQVQSTKLWAKQGDILFGKIRPYFHKVGPAPVDAVCSSDTIVLRAKDRENFGVALGCVSSDSFVDHSSQTSQGTKMPRANWGVLKAYPCPLPPAPLLTRFNEIIGDTVGLLRNFVLRNRNLRATRDLLLPRLISGEIDVSTLPPEPAAS